MTVGDLLDQAECPAELRPILLGIAYGESRRHSDAVGDLGIIDDIYGPSVGLWQTRVYKNPKQYGTDGFYRDIEKLKEPLFQAKAAVWIATKHHLRLNAWTVYRENYPSYVENIGVDGPVLTGYPTANRWNLEGVPQ